MYLKTSIFYQKYYSSGHRNSYCTVHALYMGFFVCCLLFIFFCFTVVLHPLEDFQVGTQNEYASNCPMNL